MPYVDLDRQFEEFVDQEDLDGTAHYLRLLTRDRGFGWDELLAHRVVVVLGEAGTGKTTEFQEQAQALRNHGRDSFFLPLEDLADGQPLAPEDKRALEAWKAGVEESTFFLDSIDEARLGHQAAFRRALNRFVQLLESAGSRVRVVLSCRISDWQYITDLGTIRDAFSSLKPRGAGRAELAPQDLEPEDRVAHDTVSDAQVPSGESSELEVKLVRMLALDGARVARLGRSLGIEDSDRFLTALRENDLAVFAGRPRDLGWLVAYWRQHGSFGDYTAMVEENVRQKLRERNPAHVRQNETLSSERARSGAEALAAATLFCDIPMIALPDPELERNPPARAFRPQEVLPDWDDRELQALLTRGLFDPATLGRVRFHHPSVRDYLAACWMAGKVRKGMPISKVRRLVLGDVGGRPYPVPSKRQVLGWLAGMLPEIRCEVICVAPEILLYCGDAKQIPMEERAQALRILALKLREIGHTDWTVYDSDVRRAVDPRLAPVINELLQSEADNYEAADFLLRMVRIGRLSECVNHALAIACDNALDEGIRVQAARAAAAAGSPEEGRILFQRVQAFAEMSNYLLGGFCGALFPRVINVEEVLGLARRGAPEREWSGIGLGASFEHRVVQECPGAEMTHLLVGLLELAREEPQIRVHDEEIISDQYAWTRHSIVDLSERILRELPEEELPLGLLVEAHLLAQKCKHVSNLFIPGLDRLKGKVSAHPSLRRAVYWGAVRDRLRRGQGRRFTLLHDIHELISTSENDLSWLLEDAVSLEDAEELEVTFETALSIWHLAGRPEEAARSIAEALTRSTASPDLVQRVTESLNPPPREEAPWEREQRQRQAEERASVERARGELQARMERIRTGEDIGALIYFNRRMHEGAGGSHSSWAQTNWRALAPDFGEELVQAARDGFKASWRRWVPPLPHERDEAHGVENGVIIGLTGLAIAAGEGEDFSTLSPEEANTATRYALRELNGFPGWFGRVAESHPEMVGPLLCGQIRAELAVQPGASSPGDTLVSLKYGPPIVCSLCIGSILDRLEQGDPPRIETLRHSLEIVVKGNAQERARLAQIAAQRVREHTASRMDDDSLFLWLIAWLWVDGQNAWGFIEGLVMERDEFPSPLILGIAAEFGGPVESDRGLEGADFLEPAVLERMIRTVYAHIRPEEDLNHEGTYTPGSRDRAQSFRSWMGGYLAQQQGREAQDVLLALATDLEPASVRPRMRRLAEQQAAKAVEYPSWRPSDVASFGVHHEKEPTTGRGLFEIVLDRLEDIKESIERGDFSERGLFRPGMHERPIQKWLAGRLGRESRRRYSVVREEEVDRGDKTDIRLHNPSAGLVTIEVKPVDKPVNGRSRYSFNELMWALEDQLVGQYMREAGSRHGVLVIAMLGRKQWDPRDGTGRIDFQGLIERLNMRAQEIVRTNAQVEGLRVIGFDFTCE